MDGTLYVITDETLDPKLEIYYDTSDRKLVCWPATGVLFGLSPYHIGLEFDGSQYLPDIELAINGPRSTIARSATQGPHDKNDTVVFICGVTITDNFGTPRATLRYLPAADQAAEGLHYGGDAIDMRPLTPTTGIIITGADVNLASNHAPVECAGLRHYPFS